LSVGTSNGMIIVKRAESSRRGKPRLVSRERWVKKKVGIT